MLSLLYTYVGEGEIWEVAGNACWLGASVWS